MVQIGLSSVGIVLKLIQQFLKSSTKNRGLALGIQKAPVLFLEQEADGLGWGFSRFFSAFPGKRQDILKNITTTSI